MYSFYNDEGKVRGRFTEKRLAIHSAFCYTKQVAPQIMQELHATCFEHEVAKLTLRHLAGQGEGAKKLPEQSGLPDNYVDALV